MKTITVIKHQSLFDIALMAYGTIEGILMLCLENDVAMTDELEPGRVLRVPEFEGANKEIVEYYKAKNIQPATDYIDAVQQQKLFENGLFENGLFE